MAQETGSSSSSSHALSRCDALDLAPELRIIFEQDQPRFSDGEYRRRHAALAGVMEREDVDHLLIVTAQNVGNATRWVTGWPGTNEALTVFRPGETMTMFVEYYNHLPQARMGLGVIGEPFQELGIGLDRGLRPPGELGIHAAVVEIVE